jgi:hypothetical protein
MKRYASAFVIVIVIVLPLILFDGYRTLIASNLQTIILFVTAVIVGWYTYETNKLRGQAEKQVEQAKNQVAETIKLTQQATEQVKQAKKQVEAVREANKFAALTRIHETMSDRRSYAIRRYLRREFPADLTRACMEAFNKNYTTDFHTLLNDQDLEKERDTILSIFNYALRTRNVSGNDFNFNALEAVEWTLLDYDIIALPLYNRIESAEEVAKIYGPVLISTAPNILPFVAIQWKLRGEDHAYKKAYLWLLAWLMEIGNEEQQEDWRKLDANSKPLFVELYNALQRKTPGSRVSRYRICAIVSCITLCKERLLAPNEKKTPLCLGLC